MYVQPSSKTHVSKCVGIWRTSVTAEGAFLSCRRPRRREVSGSQVPLATGPLASPPLGVEKTEEAPESFLEQACYAASMNI